jgi:3-methylcrotonyl-CoA carboxylase alpha subunit
MGIRTIGVFTDPDRTAVHTARCDVAVAIADYLDGAAIIASAQKAGADAIHPGFGFLAENAEFAAAVTEAGLIWVGPPPSAIEAMGSKAGARSMMADAGVPVLPGYDGDDQSDTLLASEAAQIGWPVIIKASAGGGGKGMQVVESADGFASALSEARRLALSAFGDDRMVLEKYLTVARHIEVQVMADAHGNCIHLWERECSIQRRHQKVIEEAPSPAFVGERGQAKRLALCEHAVQAAEAVAYVGAGTVEFVVDDDGQAYFLEMNTRIQVEHPVTECITGLDLVELQLRVAAGDVLPLKQADVQPEGWAMEARIYAEDPDNNYLPSIGRLHEWSVPDLAGIRVDSGVESGSDVTIHYDPMLAKVIASGETRELARQRLVGALRQLVALGVTTNRDHLGRVLRHPLFVSGELHTRFLDTHAGDLQPESGRVEDALVAVLIHDWTALPSSRLPAIPRNWRSSRWRNPERRYRVGEDEYSLSFAMCGSTWTIGERTVEVHSSSNPIRLEIDGVVQTFRVLEEGQTRFVRTPHGELCVQCVPEFAPPDAEDTGGGCTAPMPGKVVQVLVSEGDSVTKGQPLVVLEAMKMEQTITAPADAQVLGVRVEVGDQVDAGSVLVELED